MQDWIFGFALLDICCIEDRVKNEIGSRRILVLGSQNLFSYLRVRHFREGGGIQAYKGKIKEVNVKGNEAIRDHIAAHFKHKCDAII